ncbi:hypothetical protein ACFVAQ_35570 [Streptomyces sp. NPDC057651]|uniref:hypothetical protein n=1 Tax=Streptomyces sp. NPDC057651 TaxID=3346194 RepID=UPI0036A14C2A
MAKHTAVVASVVAAVSLAITAWGTYKAAQVADDQLSQSRDDSAKEDRAQASRISVWVEGEKPTRLVLANRSLDPAWGYVTIATQDELRKDEVPGRFMGIGVLPPCTRLNVPLSKLGTDTQASFHLGKSAPLAFVGLTFIDATGSMWLRYPSGRLEPATFNAPSEGRLTWAAEKGVEVKALGDCSKEP